MDLSALNVWLAGLGPWGILIGAALTVAAKLLKDRMNKPQPGPAPPVVPVPGPVPIPVNPSQPLLDALMSILRAKLTKRVFSAAPGQPAAEVAADITPEQFTKVLGAAAE